MVLAACKRAQVDYLVTNDRKLLEHADLAAKTPRQMMPILVWADRGGAAIGGRELFAGLLDDDAPRGPRLLFTKARP